MPVRRPSPVLSSPPSQRTPLQPMGTPRTPRRCTSPTNSNYLTSIGNRKSSDSWSSWNSSNPDDEFEWKPEQLKFLSRTLDALPANVNTPFNGRVPPPNLLDKIARGVKDAKPQEDWPHSVRATRIKLLELARARAREEAVERNGFAVIEEEQIPPDGLPKSAKSKSSKRRPLYRQSSMDFVNDSIGDSKDLSAIGRLSNRLKNNERTFVNPSYQHPRALQPINGCTSPSRLLTPHTPSTSTLNSSCYDSYSSTSSRPGMRRRSASTLATSEASTPYESCTNVDAYVPPTVKMRRSDSTGTPVPAHRPFKRAPSFGAIAQDARQSGMDQDDVSCASSDEEEKHRNTKKARTKAVPPSSPVQPSPLGNVREGSALKKSVEMSEPRRTTKRLPLRSSPLFGPELPQLSSPPAFPSRSPLPASSPATQPSSPMLLTPGSPSSPKVKTLRRVRRFDLSVGRRISFTPNGNDADEEDGEYHPFGGCTPSLGSAIQLL